MDIAALGLSIDSSPVERSVTALQQLPGAARQAAAGADQLAGAAEREARAMTQSTAAHGANARSVQVAGSASRAATAMVNDNAKAMGQLSFQTKQTLIQLPDVFQGIAGGQGVFRTAIQQGGQLVQIYGMGPGGVGGSLRQVASEMSAMITPARLLSGGLLLVVAAVVGSISVWKNYALALDDLSRITGTAATELSRLQTAANIKGIGQDDFAGGMRRFAEAVYDAKAGANDLAQLMRLNGKTISDTAGTLGTVADLIRNARDDQQRMHILQQAGLPATMEWVRLLRNGADGIQSAKEEAARFGGAFNDEMIAKAREFDEAWDRAWTNFGVRSRSAVTDAVSALSRAVRIAEDMIAKHDPKLAIESATDALKRGFGSRLNGSNVDAIYGVFGKTFKAPRGTTDDLADLAAQQHAMQMEQQRLSLLGELATVEEKVRLTEIQIIQARQQPGNLITDDDVRRIKEYAREREKLSREQARLGFLGDAATDTERYAVRVHELSNALREGKINQDDFNRAVIFAKPLFSDINGAGKEAFTSLAQAMRDGKITGQELVSVLDSLSQRLIQIAANSVWDTLIKGAVSGLSGGGGGGLSLGPSSWSGWSVGQMHSGGVVGEAYPMRYIHPAYFENAPRFGSGLNASAPGINEIPILAHRGEVVGWPDQMRQVFGGGGATTVAPVFNIDARGAQKGAGEEIVSALKAFVDTPMFKRKVVAIGRDAQSRRS